VDQSLKAAQIKQWIKLKREIMSHCQKPSKLDSNENNTLWILGEKYGNTEKLATISHASDI
jgi:hypothetical protein